MAFVWGGPAAVAPDVGPLAAAAVTGTGLLVALDAVAAIVLVGPGVRGPATVEAKAAFFED